MEHQHAQFEHVDATLDELLRLDDALSERAAALRAGDEDASALLLESLLADTTEPLPVVLKTTTSSAFEDRTAANLQPFVYSDATSTTTEQPVLIETGYVESLTSSSISISDHPIDHGRNPVSEAAGGDALLEQLLEFDVDRSRDGTVDSTTLEPFLVMTSGGEFGAMSVGKPREREENPLVQSTHEASDGRLFTLCDGTAYAPDWEDLAGLQSEIGVQCNAIDLTETATVVKRAEESDEFKSTANTTRKRQADELKYLRVKARELEAQLSELQESDNFASSSSSSPEQTTTSESRGREEDIIIEAAEQSSTMTRTPVPGMQLRAPDGQRGKSLAPESLWKRVAKSQQQGRQRAELENAKLRKMVMNQLKIVKGLEKILKKRANAPDDPMTNMRKRVRFGEESEASVFAKLAKDLDARFLETAQVFNENGFAASKVELQNTQVKVDAVQGLYMEFLDSKIVPFEMQKTQDALWRALARENIQLTDGHYANVDHTHDFITAKLAINFRHSRNHAVSDAKFVAKRFVDEDRVVFLWTVQNDAEGTFCGSNGIRLMNYGWSVIERVSQGESLSGGDDMELSIIQSCARIVPELPETRSDQEQHVGLLVDLVTGSFLRNMASFHQSAEDFLVEEALSGGR